MAVEHCTETEPVLIGRVRRTARCGDKVHSCRVRSYNMSMCPYRLFILRITRSWARSSRAEKVGTNHHLLIISLQT